MWCLYLYQVDTEVIFPARMPSQVLSEHYHASTRPTCPHTSHHDDDHDHDHDHDHDDHDDDDDDHDDHQNGPEIQIFKEVPDHS